MSAAGLPMDSAPKEHRNRVLILNQVHLFKFGSGQYEPAGEQWVECWYHAQDDVWREWSGSYKIRSTNRIHPLRWAPVPGLEAGEVTVSIRLSVLKSVLNCASDYSPLNVEDFQELSRRIQEFTANQNPTQERTDET